MQTITTIGADIAKSVLQIHGVDAGGAAIRGSAACGQKYRQTLALAGILEHLQCVSRAEWRSAW